MTLETSTLQRAGTVVLAVSTLASLLFLRSPEPRHLGYPLSFWLKQLDEPEAIRHPDTRFAVEALNSAVLSVLSRSLVAREGLIHSAWRTIRQVFPNSSPFPHSVDERRRDAAQAAEHLGNLAAPLANDLVQAFRLASEHDTRIAVARALTRIGAPAIPCLIPLCIDPNAATRARSIELLDILIARHGIVGISAPDFATVLSTQLSVGETNVILAATSVLHLLANDAGVAIPALLTNLEHPVPGVRAASARTLGRTGSHALTCVPALMRRLKDADPEVQAAAASALGSFIHDAAPAVPDLTDATRSAKAPVALAAIQALGKIGPAAEAAVPQLVTILALRDTAPVIRLSTVTALGRIARRPDLAVHPTAGALRDPDEYVRIGASRALAAFGPSAAPAVPALVAALSDQSESIRVSAAEALGSIGPAARSAIPSLQAARNNNQSVMNPPVLAAVARIEGYLPAGPDHGEFSPSRSFPDKSPP